MKRQKQTAKCLRPFLAATLIATMGAAQLRGAESDDITSLGVKGDGKTDDTDAVQAALDKGIDSLFFPAGKYLMGTVTVPADTTIRFAPRAVLKINPARLKDKTVIMLAGDRVTLDGL